MTVLITLLGPTASGKSQFAIDLSHRLKAVIINADSLQWYQGLPILSAKPSDYQGIEHLMMGIRPCTEQGSVGLWYQDVQQYLHQQSSPVIIVGGTGLYIHAIRYGLSPIPLIPPPIREQVKNLTALLSLDELKDYVYEQDPLLAADNPPEDPQRLMRGLEVLLFTGRSIRTFQHERVIPVLPFSQQHHIVFMKDRLDLRHAALQRLMMMLDQGVLDEIVDYHQGHLLLEPHSCPLAKTLGLKPFTAYLQGMLSKEDAIAHALQETMAYAKRQLTWIKGKALKDTLNPTLVNPTLDEIQDLM